MYYKFPINTILTVEGLINPSYYKVKTQFEKGNTTQRHVVSACTHQISTFINEHLLSKVPSENAMKTLSAQTGTTRLQLQIQHSLLQFI